MRDDFTKNLKETRKKVTELAYTRCVQQTTNKSAISKKKIFFLLNQIEMT